MFSVLTVMEGALLPILGLSPPPHRSKYLHPLLFAHSIPPSRGYGVALHRVISIVGGLGVQLVLVVK